MKKANARPLVENCRPQYKIIIPQGQLKDWMNTAQSEITMLLLLATGYTFAVCTDKNLMWTDSDKYISIGETDIARQAGIEPDKKELGISGYLIKTIGNSIFILGGGEPGTLNGVYGFLKLVVGFEAYAEDELYFSAKPPYYVPNMDIKEKPTFEYGYISTRCYVGRVTAYRRLKVALHPWILPDEGWAAHNTFRFLPPDIYRAEHPDWYAKDKDGKELHQLNFNKQDEYLELLVEKYIELLKLSYKEEHYKKEAIYLMLGHEDYKEWDETEETLEVIKKYGTPIAPVVQLVNKIAERLEAWINENQPGREIYLSFFAYEKTLRPPVIYDENDELVLDENGNAIPVDESVVMRDNVIVRVAPIDSNWYEPFEAESNKETRNAFKGWSALGKMSVWSYSTSFRSQYANLNNFHTLQPIYQFYAKYKPRSLYEQTTNVGGASPCLQDWRLYIQSKLIWDVNANMKELTLDFFSHYYKDASQEMLLYLKELVENYDKKWKQVGLDGKLNWQELYDAKLWAKEDLLRWLGYFDEGFKKIAKYQTVDEALYVKLHERITMESISVRFLLIVLYGEEVYDAECLKIEKDNLYLDLERFNMHTRHGYSLEKVRNNELGTPTRLLAQVWRGELQ